MAATYNILVSNGTLDVTRFTGPTGSFRLQVNVPAVGYAILDAEQARALVAKLSALVDAPEARR